MSTTSKSYASTHMHERSLKTAPTQRSRTKYYGIRGTAAVDVAVNAVSMSNRPVSRQRNYAVSQLKYSQTEGRRFVYTVRIVGEREAE